MDGRGGSLQPEVETTPGIKMPWELEGTMEKMAGYFSFWKSWELRYFCLVRNRLFYYVKKGNTNPKRIIELDGCTVDTVCNPNGTPRPCCFKLTEQSKVPPHEFLIDARTPENLETWLAAIKKASTLFMEIKFAAVARDMECLVEYCMPHWVHQMRIFKKCIHDLLDQKKFRYSFVDASGYRKGKFVRDGHTTYYVINGDFVYLCIVDERIETGKPPAFVEDIKERFENVTLFTEEALSSFGIMLKNLVELYSPGYYHHNEDMMRRAQFFLEQQLGVDGGVTFDKIIDKASRT